MEEENQYYNAIVCHVLIWRAETAVPVAPCSPWSQSHPWADKWCRSCPCTEKERRAGAWWSYCTLRWEKEGLVRVCWEFVGRFYQQLLRCTLRVERGEFSYISPSLAFLLKSLTCSVPPWTPPIKHRVVLITFKVLRQSWQHRTVTANNTRWPRWQFPKLQTYS